MTQITESDIEIITNDVYCEECEEDVTQIEALYDGEIIYSMCSHDPTDLTNDIDSCISEALYTVNKLQKEYIRDKRISE